MDTIFLRGHLYKKWCTPLERARNSEKFEVHHDFFEKNLREGPKSGARTMASGVSGLVITPVKNPNYNDMRQGLSISKIWRASSQNAEILTTC